VTGRVLIVAGSDSSGGAGIQADLKTLTALGAYGATAITAITVQSTVGVSNIFPVPAAIVADQMSAVLDDIGADCIKLGMLGGADVVHSVAAVLENHKDIPLVIDPVMVATSGDHLSDSAGIDALKASLIPRAILVTPNAAEASALTGLPVDTVASRTAAAQAIVEAGARAVVITGGDIPGDTVTDFLVTGSDVEPMTSRRIDTTNTHGTGCTFAAAVAAGVAQGQELRPSVMRARAYVQAAIQKAPGYGQGHGPLDHGHAIPPYNPKPSS
jgi:hydroxymethylpyrimidine/phosphomethylpyrimidine kinase